MITSVYPVLQCADVSALAGFFIDRLGFEEVFAADWYVSLRHGAFELAVLQTGHPTIPNGYSAPAAGVLVDVIQPIPFRGAFAD